MAFKKLTIPAIVIGNTRVVHASSTRPDGTIPGILCRCYNCQKEFGIAVGEYNRGRGLFCTQDCNRAYRTLTPEQRFWPKVNKTDTCWLWTGYTMPFGHGQIRGKDKAVLAHRLSWELHNGPIPEGMEVCHNCPSGDNPRCVNPDHLFLGTQIDNMLDAVKKKRHAFGERQGQAKLKESNIKEIVEMHDSGMTKTAISRHFNVSRACVSGVLKNTRWKHVQREK